MHYEFCHPVESTCCMRQSPIRRIGAGGSYFNGLFNGLFHHGKSTNIRHQIA